MLSASAAGAAGFLFVRSDFAGEYPDYVGKVIEIYKKARAWAIENPQETTEILPREAKLNADVAAKQMERNDFQNPVPGEERRLTILEAGKVLQTNQIIKSDIDLEKLVDELIQPSYAQKVVK